MVSQNEFFFYVNNTVFVISDQCSEKDRPLTIKMVGNRFETAHTYIPPYRIYSNLNAIDGNRIFCGFLEGKQYTTPMVMDCTIHFEFEEIPLSLPDSINSDNYQMALTLAAMNKSFRLVFVLTDGKRINFDMTVCVYEIRNGVVKVVSENEFPIESYDEFSHGRTNFVYEHYENIDQESDDYQKKLRVESIEGNQIKITKWNYKENIDSVNVTYALFDHLEVIPIKL